MKVLAALAADRAKDNGDGSFDVGRGGITEILTAGYPTLATFTYLLRLELDEAEAEDLHRFRLDVSHRGQQIGTPVSLPIAAPGNRDHDATTTRAATAPPLTQSR